MCVSLRWLGGTEGELTQARCLAALLGQWKDLNGSIYTLTLGSQGKVDVLTLRPNGTRRFTEGLISIHLGAIQWGRGSSGKFSGSLTNSRLSWQRGSTLFRWRKLQ